MLNKNEIKKLIKEKDLVENYIHLDTQLTPNGFDLTVEKVFKFLEEGRIDFSNSERRIPEGKEVISEKENEEDKYGWWNLDKGAYKIRTNETLNLPLNLIGIMFPRSSLLRTGAFTQNGVWEAGFQGKGEFILVVRNENGIRIKENARINQVVFARINEIDEGYKGIHAGLE